jgi:hypothetical protein
MLDLTSRTSPQFQASGQQIAESLIANAVPLHVKALLRWNRGRSSLGLSNLEW